MKKTFLFVAVISMMLTGCGMGTTGTTQGDANAAAAGANTGNVLGNVISTMAGNGALGNVLQSVLGLDKISKQDLVRTWTYGQPGCAFTSQQLLAQAGGEAMAATIKSKLQPTYDKVGISAANTQITFNSDGTFSSTIAGTPFSGKYTFDETTYKVTLQGLLLNINCYAKKNSDGIGLLFEAKKLLTMLQTVSKMTGNSTLQTVSDLSKNYDGLRIGFDFK
jgi:hypothetical protein